MKSMWIGVIAFGLWALPHAAAEARPQSTSAKRPVRMAAPVAVRKRPYMTSYISPRIRHDPADNPWASPVLQQARAVR